MGWPLSTVAIVAVLAVFIRTAAGTPGETRMQSTNTLFWNIHTQGQLNQQELFAVGCNESTSTDDVNTQLTSAVGSVQAAIVVDGAEYTINCTDAYELKSNATNTVKCVNGTATLIGSPCGE